MKEKVFNFLKALFCISLIVIAIVPPYTAMQYSAKLERETLISLMKDLAFTSALIEQNEKELKYLKEHCPSLIPPKVYGEYEMSKNEILDLENKTGVVRAVRLKDLSLIKWEMLTPQTESEIAEDGVVLVKTLKIFAELKGVCKNLGGKSHLPFPKEN